MTRKNDILIIGLGNEILTDDRVGIEVVRALKAKVQNVDIAEAAVGGLELIQLMNGYRKVIIIDAVITGRHEIGSLITLTPDDFPHGSAMVRHQIGLNEAIELGHRTGMDLPSEIIIYGVEVREIMTFGESCTPEIAWRIPSLAQSIMDDQFGSLCQE
jgi:hydrogenase maturation protease